jgi:hypothetical protein
MWGFRGDWAVVIVLYVLGLGFFRWLGGIGAAAQAFQRWGHREAERRRARLSANS